MGIGREVADAYIDVHGDLKSFRKDLEEARPDGQGMGEDFMTEFGKGMQDRADRDLAKRWNSVMDAIHSSGDKFDFGRMIETFDPTNFDNALDKIRDFTEGMVEAGKLTTDEWVSMDDALRGQAQSIREVQDERQRLNDMMTEAIADNKAYDRSFQGITRSIKDADLEGDFRKIAEAMARGDISKWAKGFDNFDQLRDRVSSVTDSMVELGRMTDEDSLKAREFAQEFIRGQEDMAAATERTKEQARLAKEQQDRYKASLDGMVEAHHFKKIESEFNDLTHAIGTADWSKFTKGAEDVQTFRDRVIESAFHMKAFGKIGDEEFGHIIAHLDKVTANLGSYNIELGNGKRHTIEMSTGLGIAAGAAQRIGDAVSGIDPKMFSIAGAAKALASHMAGTLSHFKGLAGLNVLGDMIEEGLQIAQNIDRVALSMGQAALKIGSAASLVISGAGGLINIMGDLASMAGIGWLAPGFLAAAGIQIGVIVAAFKDMKTRLKDLGPQFSALQDSISAAFWDQAEQPIRRLVDSLMPTLKTQLRETATQLGGLFKAFTDGFTKNATPARVEGMFKKMNAAIGIAKGAMGPLTSALVTLGEHASGYFKSFAEGIVGMSKDFDDFVTKAAKDGRLKKWTDDAIQAFKDTGATVGGLVDIFGNINKAAEDAGIGGLHSFAETIQRIADITGTAQFQDALRTYFEGAKAGADQIIGAINDRLFPAIGEIAPTMATAMDIIGEAMGTAIGMISDIITNPQVQQGVLDLSNGVRDAMTTMQTAVGPIGDSLGSLLTISGHILENLGKIFSSFLINIGPEIDKIGRKFEELADPLTGAIQEGIAALTPVIASLNQNFVTPLVNGLKDILPEISGFVTDIAPDLKNISDKLGPPFKTLAEEILPNVVSIVKQIAESVLIPTLTSLVDLLTPAFGTAMTEVSKGMKNIAEGMKALKGEANDFKWPWADAPSPKEDLQARWGQASDNNFWEDLGNVIFGGNLADMGQRALEAWNDDFGRIWDSLAKTVGDGFQRVWTGKLFGDQPGKWFGEIGDFFTKGGVDKFNDSINQWFEDNLVNPIKKGWDDAWNGLKGWYEDVKKGFQDFMSGLLGFNTSPGDEASIGGSVAGGKGRSVGGKITPEMLGMGAPDSNWLEDTWAQVSQGIAGFFSNLASGFASFAAPLLEGWNGFWADLGTNIGTAWEGITTTLTTWWTNITTGIGTWLAGIGENWNTFWGGFGTTIGEIWTGITTTLQTWWTTITTNIGTWLTGLKTNWDTFWAQLPITVQNIWTQITTWISTQATAISTNISNFITTVKTNWDNFWNGVNTKVQQIWTTVTTWIGTKVTEISTNISNFITTVRTNWDSFWNTVNQKVQTIWATIVGWIGTKAAEIRSKIDSMITTVKTNWENFWSTINQKVTEWWGKIVEGVTTGIANVVREAGTLGSKAVTAVGDTAGLLLQKGVDFAQGFINGIGQMVDDIATAAANFVQAAINAATNQQDSHSPSKVTLGLGKDYGQGYINGVLDKFDGAKAAAAGLVDSALAGLATSRMYSAGAQAAIDLADGLKSQGSVLENTFAGLMPSLEASINTTTAGFGQALAAEAPAVQAGNTVIFEKEAILVDSKASNNKIVASTVIDSINDIFES